MEDAQHYRESAASLSARDFAASHPYFFLVKHPSSAGEAGPAAADIEFATRSISVAVDPFPQRMQVARVIKRAGNPFPERISLGRASNCDIVWRLPCISKVHAHFIQEADGSLSLQDRAAANFTFVNQVQLPAEGAVAVAPGDVLGFGSLRVELCGAEAFLRLLQHFPVRS